MPADALARGSGAAAVRFMKAAELVGEQGFTGQGRNAHHKSLQKGGKGGRASLLSLATGCDIKYGGCWLLQAIRERGCKDNCTVMLVKLGG